MDIGMVKPVDMEPGSSIVVRKELEAPDMGRVEVVEDMEESSSRPVLVGMCPLEAFGDSMRPTFWLEGT
jgi:hypothetical protein